MCVSSVMRPLGVAREKTVISRDILKASLLTRHNGHGLPSRERTGAPQDPEPLSEAAPTEKIRSFLRDGIHLILARRATRRTSSKASRQPPRDEAAPQGNEVCPGKSCMCCGTFPGDDVGRLPPRVKGQASQRVNNGPKCITSLVLPAGVEPPI
mmetsp:Transcript_31866/g.85181  ORF Transcript_31866/g.85181 Transcript_31866/m.85181 type:complete len:154 (+) Transcript_31866:3276-3737(+)